MKTIRPRLPLLLFLATFTALLPKADGAAINITSTMNWSGITTGSGSGGQPSASDSMTVYAGGTLTVDVANAVCGPIGLGNLGEGPGTLIFNSGSQLTISGTLTVGASAAGSFGVVTMTSGGTLICQGLASVLNGYSPSTWTCGVGTVQLTANNSLPSAVISNFNNLILTAGTTTLSLPLIVTNLTQTGGNLALGANGLTVVNSHYAGTNTVSGTGGYTLSGGTFETAHTSGVTGNLTTTGTKTLGATNYLFNGTAAQVTSAALPATVSTLSISNAAGVTLSQSTTVTNLTLTKGNVVTTGSYQLIIANTSNSAISGGGSTSYVVGAMQKSFGSGTGQTFAFPIGTATGYTPVTLSSLNVGGSGARTITLQSVDGDHPQLGSSGINTNECVNRYWTLTQSGSTFTNCAITFNYLSGDVDSSATASSFIVQIYTNSTWASVTVVGIPTTNTTVITNYAAGSAQFAIGDVKMSSQTITFPSPGNQTYGVTPITLGGTASSGLTVSYSVTSGPAAVSNNTLTITGAGSVTIQATQSGNGSWYAATPVSQTITVGAKTVTPVIGANNKTYDGTTAATLATLSLSGVINSDVVDLVGGTATFSDSQVANGKTVTASGLSLSGANAGNYVLGSTSATTTANITPATLTVTANNTNRLYGAANPTFTASYSGFVNNETASVLSGAPSLTTTATSSSSVSGSPYPIVPALGTLSAANYTFTFVNGQLSITSTIATEAYSFATNRVVPDGDASGLSDVRTINSSIANITSLSVRLKVTGEFNGDLYAYLRNSNGFVVLLNRPGKTASNANGYADSGLDVTFQTGATNGDIHVYQNITTPAAGSPLTGEWAPDGRTNDPANVTDASLQTTSLTNFNGFAASGEWTLFIADLESGGTNMLVEWDLNISGVASPTLNWTNPADIVYGTALSGVQLNATATYNSTNVAGTFTYAIPAGTVLNAGSGQTLSVTFTPDDAGGFEAVSTNVLINVTQAPLAITAANTNMVYGAALPEFTETYSGFVNGDTSASMTSLAAIGTTATSASPVGTYPITASGAVATNYAITFVGGTLNITPASLVVTADSKTKAYGQALPALTASYNGFVNGDGTSNLTTLPSVTTTASAASDAGTYPITASSAVGSNYAISYVGGILTVTQSLTSAAVAASANPALPGTSVTFSMTISAVAPGAGAPTGTVNFRIDGSVAGSGTLSAGVASFSTSSLAHGSHTVVGEYAGSQDFVGATNSLTPNETINTPPVAGPVAIQRYPTEGVKVRLATLLAGASDADSDSLNLSVSTTSTNGGLVAVTSGWVFYTPAAGFTNADSFTYTVTDGEGGSAVGTVTVAIEVDNDPGQNLVITNMGNGSFLVSGSGIPGRTYQMQYTDSLTPTDWQDLSGGSETADPVGAFQYTDTTGSSSRSYRSVNP